MRYQAFVVAACLLLGACGNHSPAPGSHHTDADAVASATVGVVNDQPDTMVPPRSAGQLFAARLDQVVAGDWRSAAAKARDQYRHPRGTLAFFGLRPDMKVIEITPGGGWYAAILAPLLRDNGSYTAAVISAISNQEASHDLDALRKRFAATPKVFDKAHVIQFDPRTPNLGTPGSVDMVLTFRNVHNWTDDGTAPAMFQAFFDVLAPGGVLGVTDHRAAEDSTLASDKGTGYLPQDYVIKLATDAGFKLDAKSEINANPRDTKDYPKGVWTLPPTLTLGDQDRAKYQAIGESDRMTLRFVKPVKAASAASTAAP